jgi:choloylglycine hydrolase
MKNLVIVLAAICVLACLIVPASSQCSSFYLDADGLAMVGSNYDHCDHQDGLVIVNKRGVQKRGFSHGTTGQYVSWTSKYGSVTFSVACREEPYCGINEAGLVVVTASLPASKGAPPDERPPLEGGSWVQYLLDNFSTVEEVAASDSTVRIVNDLDHYLICDKEGGCLVVECRDGTAHFYMNDSAPVKAVTNTPYLDCLAHWKRGVIPDPDPNASVERFLAASQWIDDYEMGRKPGVDYAFDTLHHTSQGLCTQWRIVFDINDLRFHFRTKKVKAIRYCYLKDLDFDCATPMKMLDVNEKLRGDISEDFIDYSREAGLDYIERAVKTSGTKRTLEEIKERLNFFESFKCAESEN